LLDESAGLNVPVDLYTHMIKQLFEHYPNTIIHIYSQLTNNKSEFDIYKSINPDKIILHLDEDIVSTFVSMVYADVLVTSPSSLSYNAAILSDNEIYYIPYCSPPLSHWNIINGYKNERLYTFTIDNVILKINYDSISNTIKITNINDLFPSGLNVQNTYPLNKN
jgi:hypothetical protein